ncbi:hypothetical protein ABT369_35800 [Dactylosporangium sp. NPDC000244]|uniref:hypothetical protein n=1 Tax=Dactylosporangium sp. NPDC000244 TaxID=3154365 RepID=UPI0033199A39
MKFSGGNGGAHPPLKLEGDPAYVDVDHDGAQETIMLLSCSPQGSDYKVLAFDRDATGKIVTLGQVVGSAGSEGKQGADIETIWAVQATWRRCPALAAASRRAAARSTPSR